MDAEQKRKSEKMLAIGGISCGIALFVGISLQQYGLLIVSAGKAGFLSALYIIFVPILGIFLKKKVHPAVWLAVVISAVGLYLLSIKGDFTMGLGDIYICISALFFAVHIILVDYFSPMTDGIRLSCIQFATTGVLSGIAMILFEEPMFSDILRCWLPIIYAGVLSNGVAYTLQIIAQKDVKPASASLILSMESVFAAISGALILGERFTSRELLGCILVFAAILLAQLPDIKHHENTAD